MKGFLCVLVFGSILCSMTGVSLAARDADTFPGRRLTLGLEGNPNQICAFGDSVFGFDVQNPSGDNQCLGVEFDGSYFYITGGGGTSSPDTNKIHFFDRDGNYLSSLNQPTTSYWGWRDMAYDGNHMYSSDSDSVVEWYVTGLPSSPVLNIAGSFSGPLSTNRGMAYDPATDHFWTANWGSDIYEFDRTGMVHGNWSNIYTIYGLAWDDASPDGPWLWVFTQEAPGAVVYQWDPIIHDYTGLFLDLSHVGGIAAGAAFTTDWNPRYGILFCLHQTDPDAVIGYEIVSLCEPVEPPQMRSQGYWRRQCKDDAHEDICAYVDSIHVLADLFDAFDCDSICDLMKVNPPERHMCRKARRQFMALLLNVASGKLSVCNCLEDGREVGDVIVEVDSLLSGSPDHATCVYAKTLADDINTGTSIVPCDSLFYLAPPKSALLVSPSIAPNPFANTTTIQYEVPSPQSVQVQIYDKTGRLVRALVDARHEAGAYYIEWNGLDEVGEKVPSGTYFSRIQTKNSIRSNKLILLR